MMTSSPTDTSTIFHCIFWGERVFDLWHTKLHWILADNICLGDTGPQNLVLHPSWVWVVCVLSNSRHCSFRVMACFGHPPVLAPLVHLGTTTNNTNCTSIDISQHSFSATYITNQHTTFKYVSTAALCNQTEYQTRDYINSKQSKD